MSVFATRFLEEMKPNKPTPAEAWVWKPANPNVYEIYASGRSTSTRESTYQAEKDNRGDTDRPNEG
jgi:hypothetical protein